MSRCLVFGQTGQVAQALQGLVHEFPGLDLVFLDRSQADFFQPDTLSKIVLSLTPAVVINAAAYTKVDQAETDEVNANLVNAQSPGAIAEACHQVGSALIHLSTDYVFAGDASQPYAEQDPIAPTGAYGRSKAKGEEAVRSALERHLIVRTAWVYSATGQNFVKTMLRLKRDLIRVVDDQKGNPTPAHDIARTCLTMAERIVKGTHGAWGTYHFSGQPATTWYGFATQIFAEAQKLGHPAPKLEPITTDQYPTPAKRPAWSVLDNAKIIREWGIEPPHWPTSLPPIIAQLLQQG